MNKYKKQELENKMEEYALKYAGADMFERKDINLEVIDLLKSQNLSFRDYTYFSCMFADKRREVSHV